jgi:alpha-beta hydrolase superfamily lysophospholipase
VGALVSRILGPATAASRRLGRLALRGVVLLVGGALAVALGFTLYAVSALPPLQPWHTERLHEEFSASRDAGLDFDAYLQLESRLFAALQRNVDAWRAQGEDLIANTRYDAAGPSQRMAAGAPYNRSYRLTLARPLGHALLIHGLTDSPYSMKALAESLHQRGFEVTVLRVPGHGTLPSMMVEMRAADWTAAVRIAARDVAARTPAGQPFYIGGYSTGGTLALQHALDALEDGSLRRPDRVLLVSPAIRLTPVAKLAEIIDAFSLLPIPLLEKVRWQEIGAEFDPYKFNSFPVNASRQVNRATLALRRSLERASRSGAIARLPPVVTWQSAVDSTVGALGAPDTLYARLEGPQHRLVMFDVNRQPALRSVLRPGAGLLIDRLAAGPRGHTLDVVSNVGTGDARIQIRRVAPGGAPSTLETTLEWPAGLVSLGHVALPFPADDPVYGFLPGSGRDGVPSLGSWLLRGESGAITVSLGSLTRLRSNPFWALIDEDVGTLVAADLGRGTR